MECSLGLVVPGSESPDPALRERRRRSACLVDEKPLRCSVRIDFECRCQPMASRIRVDVVDPLGAVRISLRHRRIPK
jgi:hypothetical protein